MDILKLNKYLDAIQKRRCKESFEKLLVEIDYIINSYALIVYEKVEDKILNELCDIKQDILINLWIHLISDDFTIFSEKDLKDYIRNIAMDVLSKGW